MNADDRATIEDLPARMSAVESEIVQMRDEMRALNEDTRREMRALNEETRLEMRALHHEAMAQTRMLHEEVLGRIATLTEGRRRPRKP